MGSTPFPEANALRRTLQRKRTRSPSATSSLGSPSQSFPHQPPPLLSMVSVSTPSEATAAEWSTMQHRFAVAQWRRGCFHLSSQAPPTSTHLGRPAAKGAPGDAGVTTADADQAMATVAARYIPPHPWKVLRSVDDGKALRAIPLSTVKGALLQPVVILPAFLAPPELVQLEKWNAYWAAYSTCCADALEGLAKQLESPTSTVKYRRVLVTLSEPAFSRSPTPPTAVNSSVATAPAAHARHLELMANTRFPVSAPSHKGSKTAEREVYSPISPISSASGSPLRSSLPLLLPAPALQEVPVSPCSHPPSYSSYSSSCTSHSRSGSDTDSATKAAHAEDAITGLSFLPSVLDDLLHHYAHRFGAVEHLDTRDSGASTGVSSSTTTRVIVSVQFTTAEAAGLFLRWADGMSVAEVIAAYRRGAPVTATPSGRHLSSIKGKSAVGTLARALETGLTTEGAATQQDELDGGGAAWWDTLEEASRRCQLRLVAKLAPHDPRRLTARLLLGPNVMVATPLVRSLFAGLFDVTQVEYLACLRAFRIDFASKNECRLALHALQCSLWRVFGVPLIFT
ncbi:hypothetical protein CUR178_01435 [Leishmania enriettii]|uniref:Uncharacterized protein n=1 Tax=Leishmania enriettii TaxID=5663 RepID=A0A836G5U9_LEIEN|nr:hypothetical protein CUR178_01435 [Leishmania enriettii]